MCLSFEKDNVVFELKFHTIGWVQRGTKGRDTSEEGRGQDQGAVCGCETDKVK